MPGDMPVMPAPGSIIVASSQIADEPVAAPNLAQAVFLLRLCERFPFKQF